MTVAASVISAATTATALHTADADGAEVALHNSGSATVFVGPSDLTTSTGFPLAAGATVSMRLSPAEAIYGIVASGTEDVSVLVLT